MEEILVISIEKADQFRVEAKELEASAPRFKQPHFLTAVVCAIISPLFRGLLRFGFNRQYDPTPIERQHHNAKRVRLLCRHFDIPDSPEILTSPTKCEGACGNHVSMLVRSTKSLCFTCWGQTLKSLG
jgi:hypothetical protein